MTNEVQQASSDSSDHHVLIEEYIAIITLNSSSVVAYVASDYR